MLNFTEQYQTVKRKRISKEADKNFNPKFKWMQKFPFFFNVYKYSNWELFCNWIIVFWPFIIMLLAAILIPIQNNTINAQAQKFLNSLQQGILNDISKVQNEAGNLDYYKFYKYMYQTMFETNTPQDITTVEAMRELLLKSINDKMGSGNSGVMVTNDFIELFAQKTYNNLLLIKNSAMDNNTAIIDGRYNNLFYGFSFDGNFYQIDTEFQKNLSTELTKFRTSFEYALPYAQYTAFLQQTFINSATTLTLNIEVFFNTYYGYIIVFVASFFYVYVLLSKRIQVRKRNNLNRKYTPWAYKKGSVWYIKDLKKKTKQSMFI